MEDAELDVMNTEQDDPLLQSDEEVGDEPIPNPSEPVTVRRKINQTKFIVLCIIVLFALEFAAFFDFIPQTRIFEVITCRNYFDKHHPDRFPYPQDIPESECKIKAVQSEIAYVQALAASFDALPTDVVDEVNRSTVYFQTSLTVVVAQLLAPSIGSAMMMKFGPWLPYYFGTAFFTICCPLILLLPETIPLQIERPVVDHSEPAFMDDNISGHDPHDVHGKFARASLGAKLRTLFSTAWKESKSVLNNRTVLLILSTFLLSTLGRKQIDLLLLYASTRYDTTISKAGFVHSFMACVSIVLLLLVLPISSSFLSNTLGLSSNMKDLWLSKISVVFLTIGSFAIGFSPTFVIMVCAVTIYTLGCGFNAVCLSLVSSFVDPKYGARLYSIISLIIMFGTLLGGPFLAGLFNLGLNLGSPAWTGLPFFGSGVVHIFIVISVWYIRLPSLQLA
ncbi:uncharacterized protein GIQ15_02228 [Arthroderma uncinatum]|uniref:uncharacterized protein n=1 Tax=Arthroderma uncinatum TaxID=74035 RepID=UPI00144A63B0|nr:uncharacterized protein GIQ15_02228 [Arthroderma uncinatum]KAF3482904.1 hypothetical protein GIQ15_02228 [Arthroderma uncinatum]